MRVERINLPLFTLLGIIVGAFVLFGHLERLVHEGFSAEVTVQSGLSALRSLQIDIRALQSERANIRSIEREWQDSRLRFDKSLREMTSSLADKGLQLPQLSRMQNTWSRMEVLHSKVRSSLDALDRTGFMNRVGNSSLVGKYQEVLTNSAGSDLEVAELSLLLFYLEHADRMVQEIETELASLEKELAELTNQRVEVTSYARMVVAGVSGLLVLLLLLRISRLYAALATDNAARRQAEKAARESEADLSAVLNAIGDVVIATDEKGDITRANLAAAEFFRSTPGDLIGKQIGVLVVLRRVSDGAQEDPAELALKSASADQHRATYLVSQADGSERRLSVLSSRILSHEGNPAGAVLVFHDITDQYLIEEQLRRTQRLEALGRLAGGVAHDFNNLLQIMKANLAFLHESPSLGAEEKEYVDQIEDASTRAADLTRQLLALGRRQTLQFREINLAGLLNAFLALIRRVIGENVELSLRCAPDLDWVRGDAGQLEQVLLNLCMNARDAMEKSGLIVIELDNCVQEASDLASAPWAKPGRHVCMRVIDTGRGMGPEIVARLFEPFFSTKQEGRTSGLGLSVVHGIIQQHGGFVSVRSELGKGTIFSVYLPSHQPGHAPSKSAETTTGSSLVMEGRNELVLFVEDEAPVRQVGASILQRNGFRVLAAKDGEEACVLAREHRNELSLAILDVIMPRLGGIEAAREIRGFLPKLPVILCTGYTGVLNVPELNEESGWKMITKPYSNRELASQARRAIDEATMTRGRS